MRLDTALWRALGVYRGAAWLYAVGSTAAQREALSRPGLAVVVLALMAAWSVAAVLLLADPARRRPRVLVADVVLSVAAVLSSLLVLTPEAIAAGAPTLPVSWAAAPVLAWAVWGGWVPGVLAAAAVGAAAVVERGELAQATANSVVLLLLAGGVVGHVVTLGRRAETAYASAVQQAAAQAERERLARTVHDGVLQTLALVSGRSQDPALAALAAEQEVALRRLVAAAPEPVPVGDRDLLPLLPVRPGVELSRPAGPVLLPAAAALELAAAVGAAVDNALKHGGGRAWLLVEDEPGAVTVTIRDEGPGIAPGRLDAAEGEGRLGVARSVRGRVADLGGTTQVLSEPGRGTEVELRVPR